MSVVEIISRRPPCPAMRYRGDTSNVPRIPTVTSSPVAGVKTVGVAWAALGSAAISSMPTGAMTLSRLACATSAALPSSASAADEASSRLIFETVRG